ncbi:uncharacterized protein LTR77_006949 [Saxophila tyrrhenica]|uniref:F-box domain-containing protein n=1 Tax=Saxophila tyrrhenica TaxID=1690608 RepID=A0AAV9P6M2_9PEZI|nr:hypothetical protein LTR77_006949 [Saxophila tyrrhenica]
MRYIKPAAGGSIAIHTLPPATFDSSVPQLWSDVAASRKSTHPDAPVKQVFRTFELLENILLYLEPKDILRIQRTCRTLEEVTTNSPPLQRKLFLAPDEKLNVPDWYDADPHHAEHLWQDSVLTGKPAHDHLATSLARKVDPVPYPTVVFNTLILTYDLNNTTDLTISVHSGHDLENRKFDCLEPVHWIHDLPRDAGCRKMFLTHPPVTHVVVEHVWNDSGHALEEKTIHAPEGVRYGQVIDVVREAWKRCKEGLSYCEGWDYCEGWSYCEDCRGRGRRHWCCFWVNHRARIRVPNAAMMRVEDRELVKQMTTDSAKPQEDQVYDHKVARCSCSPLEDEYDKYYMPELPELHEKPPIWTFKDLAILFGDVDPGW